MVETVKLSRLATVVNALRHEIRFPRRHAALKQRGVVHHPQAGAHCAERHAPDHWAMNSAARIEGSASMVLEPKRGFAASSTLANYWPAAAQSNERPDDSMSPSTSNLNVDGAMRTTIDFAKNDPVINADPAIRP